MALPANNSSKRDKMKKIATYYGKHFDDVVKDMYILDQKSSISIAETITNESGIPITTRSIQHTLKKLNITRNRSSARHIAIKTGRMDYTPYKKSVKSSKLRKGISIKKRFQILERDGHKCVLCGATPKDDVLQIDHIIPVTNGGTNDLNNLRVLCRTCNLGKKQTHREK